jgi:predicted transcriptional regulator
MGEDHHAMMDWTDEDSDALDIYVLRRRIAADQEVVTAMNARKLQSPLLLATAIVRSRNGVSVRKIQEELGIAKDTVSVYARRY